MSIIIITRSSKRFSTESPDFLSNWAIDVIFFKRLVRAFIDQIYNYRRLLQLVIYIRQYDSSFIEIILTRLILLSGNPFIVLITSINIRVTFITSVTLTKEAIYNKLIRPESRSP